MTAERGGISNFEIRWHSFPDDIYVTNIVSNRMLFEILFSYLLLNLYDIPHMRVRVLLLECFYLFL